MNTAESTRSIPIRPTGKAFDALAIAATRAPRLVVEAITPCLSEGGAVRRLLGDTVRVEADAYGEGHDAIAVSLKWREADALRWHEVRMQPLGNDRYWAEFQVTAIGRWTFAIEAWRDEFAIFQDQLIKKADAGVVLTLDLEEGRRLVGRILAQLQTRSGATGLDELGARLEQLTAADEAGRLKLLRSDDMRQLMQRVDPRAFRVVLERDYAIEVERPAAAYGAWYALFPRSQSGDATRHGTFDDVIGRLPAIKAMGFDVVYLLPIHPIGTTNRKGRNNSLKPAPDDPGSPYAIGSSEGGHDAIHPELGTFEDFHRLVAATQAQGMELALDLAIQASPDHPWLKEHPEWFDWRPDGTIRFAENPPKKYEDIVNVDFYTAGAKPALWIALRDVVLFWVGHGVKIFRVDNPHTKPFPFWEWMIAAVRVKHPDVIFLSEAFTRPKIMYRLAKIGFSQSYTYFTWRNTKAELIEYFTELSEDTAKDFFRPNLFVNTHDINPDFLHNAPRSAFLIRVALAATLSGLWGLYNGFELCEGRPDDKQKEYADSEKYQLVAWDWDRPGNIIPEITALNDIRHRNLALHSHLGVRFLEASSEKIVYFEKSTPTRDNVLLIAISLDAYGSQEADIEVPPAVDGNALELVDLINGEKLLWDRPSHHLRLDADRPYAIWQVQNVVAET